ncbi:MAG TPA: MASE1 domain-containing protein [Steroidobacteraceae bacterium]|jgi:PAS domain S-box-containing protein|nr:MASE1 domain-containing protein [Steroidobacteraceae bacterium]
MLVQDRITTTALRLLFVFVSVFALAAIGISMHRLGGSLTLSYLPNGIAVAVTYRFGRRVWPAVFLAGIAIELWNHEPLPVSIGVGIGLASGAWFSAWLLERGGFDSAFSRAKDVLIFIVAVGLGMTLAPIFSLPGYYLAGMKEFATDFSHWIRWWSNAISGALLVGPLLVAYRRNSFERFTAHWAEAALWLLGLIICCASIMWAPGSLGRPLIVVFAILLIVVSAMRFGLVIAAAASFVISTMTAISAAFSIGAFAQFDQLQGLVTIWSFIVSLSGLSIVITALLGEREAAALEVLRAEQRYAQIFNGSPQPLWVHSRDSLRFLVVNDAATRQYGWSREELLSRSVEILSAEAKQPVLPPVHDAYVTADLPLEPYETRHRTKDGRVLEVEVWTQSIDCGGQPGELVFAIDVTERRAFGQALMEAIGGEQRRIAQEMHDGLGQELTGLALSVRALANRAQKERDAISFDLDQLALLATSCIQDAHRIVQGLSPLTNADGNLDAALDLLAQRSSMSGTRVRFEGRHEAPPMIELKTRNHLYRIAQEAVQNALKHSGAKNIAIELWSRPGDLRLSIIDDGRGLEADADTRTGLGMRTMRFRANAIGGRLSISRNANGGNSVVCDVPTKPLLAATA